MNSWYQSSILSKAKVAVLSVEILKMHHPSMGYGRASFGCWFIVIGLSGLQHGKWKMEHMLKEC
jgi:hypothetical protein